MRIRKENAAKKEEFILMGMLISTELLNAMPIDKNFFTSVPAQYLCEWILDYHGDFGKAPGTAILAIFDSKKASIEREDAQIIHKMLERIDGLLASNQGNNSDYYISESRIYFEKRELEIKIEKAQNLIATWKIQEAKEELEKASKIGTAFFEINDCNPLSDRNVDEALFTEEEGLFEYPGAVGQIIGPLQRKWTVAFQAPQKRGKTNLLYESSFLAASQGLKVYSISMEMEQKSATLRWAKRIMARDKPGQYTLPVFDCELNQKGICKNKHRPDNGMVIHPENGNRMDFDPTLNWKVCTYCRGKEKYNHIFVPSIWHEIVEKPSLRQSDAVRTISAVNELFGDNIVSVHYPKFSKTIIEIFTDLDRYIDRTGFVPDIITFDYWDITKPLRSGQGRDFYDETWKIATGYSQKYNCLQFGCTQGSRASIKKFLMEEEDTSEDIRKLGHVDALFSLNQSREEKRENVARIGCLVHRHRGFDVNVNAMVLQHIGLGQVIMDSELVYVESDASQWDNGNGRKRK